MRHDDFDPRWKWPFLVTVYMLVMAICYRYGAVFFSRILTHVSQTLK